MSISASDVKQLREKTGVGMMDCKKALVESGGDIEAAVDWLRTRGVAIAAKKSGRVASEGLAAVCIHELQAAVVEVNAETDFVSKNTSFQTLVSSISEAAINSQDLDTLKTKKLSGGKNVVDTITDNIATIGENLSLRRMQNVSITNGVISSYVHNHVAPNMGKVAVLVALESNTSEKTKLAEFGKQLAMHIAAANPLALNESGVDTTLLQREKEICREQSKNSGKPDHIVEKMVEGRVQKYLKEIVLLNQIFVIDGKNSITAVIQEKEKELGDTINLTTYVRYEVGEGIQKDEKDFADEVAAVAQK